MPDLPYPLLIPDAKTQPQIPILSTVGLNPKSESKPTPRPALNPAVPSAQGENLGAEEKPSLLEPPQFPSAPLPSLLPAHSAKKRGHREGWTTNAPSSMWSPLHEVHTVGAHGGCWGRAASPGAGAALCAPCGRDRWFIARLKFSPVTDLTPFFSYTLGAEVFSILLFSKVQ